MGEVMSGTHAKLSPSGAKRWMSCPGSIALVEELGIKDTTSKYAAEGTVAHEVGELCLLNNKQPEEYLGVVLEADGMKFTVNRNMVDAVTQYTDYIRSRVEWGEDQGFRVEVLVEVKCPLTSLGIEGMDGGTSDTVLLFWDNDDILCQVEVIDYKHGQGVAVEIDNNSQLMSYGLGMLINVEVDELDNIPTIMTIVQPRAYHHKGGIRSCEMSSGELFEWQDTKLIPAALATQQENAPLIPSESACRFCNASGSCRKLEELTQETAMVDFDDIEPTTVNPNIMTTQQKVNVVSHANMLRAFIVAVENQVKLEVDAGSTEYTDHFKLVKSKSHRKLVDDYDDDFSPLMDYLEPEELFTKKSLPLGEIETLLKDKLKGNKGSIKLAKEIMSEITIKPEGKLVIAPLSDSRTGVQPSIVSDFENMD